MSVHKRGCKLGVDKASPRVQGVVPLLYVLHLALQQATANPAGEGRSREKPRTKQRSAMLSLQHAHTMCRFVANLSCACFSACTHCALSAVFSTCLQLASQMSQRSRSETYALRRAEGAGSPM